MKRELDNLLINKFGDILVNLTTLSEPHDFGNSISIAVYYDTDNEKQREQAFYCESHTPEEWSPENRKQLYDYLKQIGFSYENQQTRTL